MSIIHLAGPQGQPVTHTEAEALRLWNEGALSAEWRYWREGMTEWRPIAECFASATQPSPAMPAALPLPVQAQRGFAKDPAGRTMLLVGLLWAYLGLAAVAVVTSGILVATGQAGQVDPENLTPSDITGLLVGVPQSLVLVVTGIVFLMWIHLANRNARAIGAVGMTFTPGWSVGWYFVPIANLWKPYQAMKEIWKASANPAGWRSQPAPALLSTWWTLWILSNLLGNASFRLSLRANDTTVMLASEVVTLISDLVDIPLCLVAMRMVREIVRRQTHWAAQPVESRCAVCGQPISPSDMVCLNQTWVCARCKPIALQQLKEGASGA